MPIPDFLKTSVDFLPSTSSLTKNRLKTLEIQNYWDVLNYFPTRYENYSLHSTINRLQEGELVTVKGKVIKAKNEFTRRGMKIQKVTLDDGTGHIDLIWYNQLYLIKMLKPGTFMSVSGQVKRFLHSFSLEPAEYEILSHSEAETIHTGKLIPIYPEKKGISSKTLRDKIYKFIYRQLDALKQSELEWLPTEIRSYNKLVDELTAYKQIHFPSSLAASQQARERLAFDELFTVQMSVAIIKKEWQKEVVGNKFVLDAKKNKLVEKFITSLPFELTNAQKKTSNDIIKDLLQEKPMNRFIQGDVGSGKTVIAAIAAYISYLNGYQSLIMAPTEILAQQHYITISKLMKDLPIKVGLQTGGTKIKTKDTISDYDIIIGTHALLTASIQFNKVGLVVIDEQHRFGVAQRATLKSKGINPHLLTMTATPIPRTIALTIYGELDMTVIDEMPKGRLPIKTYLVPNLKRPRAYEWIKEQIKAHKTQVFIICPLIEESETETMKSVKAANKEYELLKSTVFKDFSLGLLHGKMKPKDKEQVMKDFKDKKYDILVSTSVVEVGIDVPNATIMLIEGAQRYGLAQLHQLRGRVGRGQKQSYCYLFTSDDDTKNIQRLQFFTSTNSGIKLAEYDLKHRGAGDIYGTRQHGWSDLKLASFSDYSLIERTKGAVDYFLNKYTTKDFPNLEDRINTYRVQQISRD